MLTKIFKNKVYIAMILGVLIALISLICCIFIESRAFFTIAFIVNICMNFSVTAFMVLSKGDYLVNFRCIALYLLTTLFMLLMDVVIISNVWDLNSYSNLMYVKNIELYLGLYSVFVLVMVLMAIYVILKSRSIANKANIRQ